eukprot:scaffold193_cov45-Phaeocystis_antarctica.AAC.1
MGCAHLSMVKGTAAGEVGAPLLEAISRFISQLLDAPGAHAAQDETPSTPSGPRYSSASRPVFQPQDYASLVWGLSCCGHGGRVLLGTIAERVVRLLSPSP